MNLQLLAKMLGWRYHSRRTAMLLGATAVNDYISIDPGLAAGFGVFQSILLEISEETFLLNGGLK